MIEKNRKTDEKAGQRGMYISEEYLARAAKQLWADCGGSGEADEAAACIVNRTPRLPERGYLTKEAYAQLIEERWEKQVGVRPRIYEGMDPFFRGIFWKGRAWLTAQDPIYGWCVQTYQKQMRHPEWFCQFSELRKLDAQLGRYGRRILDVRLNFLPAEGACAQEGTLPSSVRECWYEEGELMENRKFDAFRHALCHSGLHPDMLAVAAVASDGWIVGMAGAAADCRDMWQIGVDVLPAWEGKGIGSALTRMLKEEMLRRGILPFYSTAQSHIRSMHTTMRAGFLPAWTEIYAEACHG